MDWKQGKTGWSHALFAGSDIITHVENVIVLLEA